MLDIWGVPLLDDTGLSVLYGGVFIFATRRLSRGEKSADNKKVMLYREFTNFWLAQFSRLEIEFFLEIFFFW